MQTGSARVPDAIDPNSRVERKQFIGFRTHLGDQYVKRRKNHAFSLVMSVVVACRTTAVSRFLLRIVAAFWVGCEMRMIEGQTM